MQLTGSQFTNTAALVGNDLATFPDFPAEIRAPAGTLPGRQRVPGQLRVERHLHAGRRPDVLVAMNPAALKVNLADLQDGRHPDRQHRRLQGDRPQEGAGYAANPLEDGSLEGYRVFPVELTKLTRAALEELGLDAKSMDRCKNFFALGMCTGSTTGRWTPTHRWLDEKFGSKPVLVEANMLALKAGYAYCETTEVFQVTYEVPPAKLAPGVYRNIIGQQGARARLRRRGAEGGAAAVPRQLPDHAGLRHPARAVDVQELRRRSRSRPRTRSPRSARRSAPPSAARSAITTTSRPGHGAQDRGDRPRGDGRAAARHRRHPARRALDRPADQDRAGRPAPGAVRPQRRGAGAGARGAARPATASGSRSRRSASRSST